MLALKFSKGTTLHASKDIFDETTNIQLGTPRVTKSLGMGQRNRGSGIGFAPTKPDTYSPLN
jgi:hypothetical protein